MNDKSTNPYPPPVDKLLTCGDVRESVDWLDYRQFGLGPEHVPDLIRMATDDDLLWADSDSLEVWAPIHAWRALGQLHAEAASEPLLTLFDALDAEDWILEEMPDVYALIGPAAIPALTAYLADASHLLFSRVAASSCLQHIGAAHAEARAECVAALSGQLERFAENDPTLNADLIASLLELKAVESAPAMARAFAAECVDLSVTGDWEDAQVELGLKPARDTPRPNYLLQSMPGLASLSERFALVIDKQETARLQSLDRQADKKAKAKRKQADKARKKNRKKRR